MKKINLCLLIAIAIGMLTSCENNEDVISKKDVSVVDFLDLYGHSKNEIRELAKKFYIKEDNYSDDGDMYWIIQTNRNNYKVKMYGDKYFVSLEFNGSICNDVSLLNTESGSDYFALDDLKHRYGSNFNEREYWWYDWILSDGSKVTYFGQDQLLIYRKDIRANNAPKAEIQRRIKMLQKIE